MKILRILTGVHAGARLRLAAQAYRVSTADDADIRIGDCGNTGATITVDANGVVTLIEHKPPHDTLPGASNEATSVDAARVGRESMERGARTSGYDFETPILIPDFVPFKLGDVAICVGDEASEWPTDIELLDTLFNKEKRDSAIGQSSRKIMVYMLCSALVVLVTATIVLLLSAGSGEAAQARNVQALAQRTSAALAQAGFNELHAAVRGPAVVITGMVRTAEDDSVVRSVLNRLAGRHALIERRYDIAANIIRTLVESEDMHGARAEYEGNGVFKVAGSVDHLARARDLLTKLGPDFDGNVRRIDDQLTQAADAGPPTPYSEVISNPNVQFLQTPDGAKHLYLVR